MDIVINVNPRANNGDFFIVNRISETIIELALENRKDACKHIAIFFDPRKISLGELMDIAAILNSAIRS